MSKNNRHNMTSWFNYRRIRRMGKTMFFTGVCLQSGGYSLGSGPRYLLPGAGRCTPVMRAAGGTPGQHLGVPLSQIGVPPPPRIGYPRSDWILGYLPVRKNGYLISKYGVPPLGRRGYPPSGRIGVPPVSKDGVPPPPLVRMGVPPPPPH